MKNKIKTVIFYHRKELNNQNINKISFHIFLAYYNIERFKYGVKESNKICIIFYYILKKTVVRGINFYTKLKINKIREYSFFHDDNIRSASSLSPS